MVCPSRGPGHRSRLEAKRKEIYQLFAVEMRRRYKTVALEKMDLTKLLYRCRHRFQLRRFHFSSRARRLGFLDHQRNACEEA